MLNTQKPSIYIVYFTLSHFVSSKMFGRITTNSLKFVGKGRGKQKWF